MHYHAYMYKFSRDIIFTIFRVTGHPWKLNPQFFNANGTQGLITNDH